MAITPWGPSKKPGRTIEECIGDAKRFNCRREWRLKSRLVYTYAVKKGWLERCVAHMVPLRPDWTLDQCRDDAKNHGSLTAWRDASPAAYRAARKYGWVSECAGHMPPARRTARPKT